MRACTRTVAALLTVPLLFACAPSAAPAPEAAVASRAAPGDTVWAVFNYAKPEKREPYERFLHEVFWPMGERLGQSDSTIRRVFAQTRILHPTEPNEDGTYTYAFFMDPVLPGGEYTILKLLQRGYGEAEGERIYREQFEDALADRDEFYQLVQSPD